MGLNIEKEKLKMKIRAIKADITTLQVDAIVNAANSSLLGGGGVDGAIHRAAGAELLAACRLLHGCKTGQAKHTLGYRLPAKYVIHTVGPVWNGGHRQEAKLLEDCYKNSLAIATQIGARTIAFPSISTGAYRFPIEEACKIAVETVRNYLSATDTIDEIIFCCFSANDLALYEQSLTESI